MILDGNSLINRAFYGVRPLTTGDGLHTHAVYGFLMILNKLLREDEPEADCCTFDRNAPTFRHALYDGAAIRTASVTPLSTIYYVGFSDTE